MPRARDMRSHEETIQAIKAIARQQMAVKGAASLSLGAIARALDVSTPALYRYFDSRDALVTELIVDAFSELGEVAEEAVADLAPEDLSGRFRELVRAYRRWALRHPQDYILAHGAVMPGYQAPVDRLLASVLRTISIFFVLLEDARAAGRLNLPPAYLQPPAALRDAFAPLEAILPDGGPEPALVMLAYMTWLRVHALVWQEVAGHLPEELFGDGKLFELEMLLVARTLGLADGR